MNRIPAGVVLVCAACSAGTGGDGNGTSGVDPQAEPACREVMRAGCDVIARCGLGSCSDKDVADRCATLLKEFAAGREAFDYSMKSACLSFLQTATCESMSSAEPCQKMLVGRVALGGDCYNSENCAGDAFCSFDVRCPGTCTAMKQMGGACTASDRCKDSDCAGGLCKAYGQAGSPCGGDNPGCDMARTFCRSGTGARTCTAFLAADASCTDEDVCVLGRACMPASAGATTGTCKVRGDEGAPCADSDNCGVTLGCFGASSGAFGQCARYKAAGEACTFGKGECTLGNYCDKAVSRCAAPGTAGAVCGDQGSSASWRDYAQCAAGHYCGTDRKCAARKRVGEACAGTGYGECDGGYCKSGATGPGGVCTVYTAPGQPCSSGTSECRSYCDNGVCGPASVMCEAP